MTPARSRTIVEPGALTALLGELARAPGASGWAVPATPGERIGRFEIVRELGRGGFGVVYEARDTELGRSVAFKAIRAGSSDAVREARLLAEAEAAARLAHPNIAHLYDVGRCDRGAFLIMELLRGETLDERLARAGPPKLREAVRVAAEIARGLAHAHEQGVVHRDLKPGNVFLCDDGQVKVLDFGLAHVFGSGGLEGGTPAYMAPEQARGQPTDERADVYALGVIVHELVTGRLPFEDGEGGVPAGGKAPELAGAPAALSKLVASMLARVPAARPASAAEVHAALAAVQRALQPRKLLWAGWTLAAVALAAAAAFALRSRPLPEGRLLVAVSDVDNQTGEAELDGVSELLQAGLDQSRRVSIIARSRLVNVLRQAGRAPPRVIPADLARSAAAAAQAQLLVVPAVRRTEGGYDVAVRAVDLARGEPAFSVRELAGTKATVPAALERLVQRVRKSLREDPKDAPRHPVSVAEMASANAEAMRLHAEGKRLNSESRFDEALEAYERAVAADPDFVLPRMELLEYGAGWVPLSRMQDARTTQGHVAALRKNAHRLPEKERAWLEAYVLLWDGSIGNLTEEIALYDRAIEAWPEDPRPYVAAARQLLAQRADVDAARPYLEKAVAIAPLDEGWAIDFLIALDRLDEALARARRWADDSRSELAFVNLALAHRVRGELPEALDAALRSLPPAQARGGLGLLRVFALADALGEAEAIYTRYTPAGRPPPRWLALRGRVREALALWDQRAPGPGAPVDDRADHAFIRGFLLLSRGDPDAVWRQAEAAFRVGHTWFPCYAWPLAALGDLERASRLGEGPNDHHVCARMALAFKIWKDGDREAALRAFSRISVASSHLASGEILSELGRDREAVEEFRAYRLRLGLNLWDEKLDHWNVPRSLYLEAAALERLGETAQAREVIGRLLHLWERADADLPLRRSAKALAERVRQGAAR